MYDAYVFLAEVNWSNFFETAGTVLVTLVASYPVFKMAVRTVVRDELAQFESKEQSQLRWEGHRLEVQEMRHRYDDELKEIKRRIAIVEEAVKECE